MAWQTDMLEMLRGFIGDMDSPYTYSDEKLTRLLLIASRQVLADGLEFDNDYEVSITASSITPDPSGPPIDYNFENLVVIKAACLLTRAEAKSSSANAVTIKDGISQVSLGNVYKAKSETAKTICDDYNKAKNEYSITKVLEYGKAVLGPFSSEDLLQGGGFTDKLEFF